VNGTSAAKKESRFAGAFLARTAAFLQVHVRARAGPLEREFLKIRCY
jgi:hypothetical protein